MRARLEPPPPNYAPISQAQVIAADRKLWVKLAELTRAGVQVTAAGRPLDAVWAQACDHPDVLHLLQPMPVACGSTPLFRFGKGEGAESKGSDKFRGGPYGRGKGAGKSKGGGFVPKALEGGVSCATQGHALCFGHNLGTCKEKVERQRCSKGLHLCCFPGCFGNHRFLDCPKRGDKREAAE